MGQTQAFSDGTLIVRGALEALLRPDPSIDGALAQRRSRLLAAMSLIVFAIGVALTFNQWLIYPDILTQPDTWVIIAGILICLGVYLINRAGHVDQAAGLFIGVMYVVFVFVPFMPTADDSLLYFAIFPILMTAIFFSLRATIEVTVSITVFMIVLSLLIPYVNKDHALWVAQFFVLTSGVLLLFIMHLQYQERVRRSELEAINQRLRASEESLEQRVRERTRDLRVAADVSLQITTVLDSERLLADVAEQTASAFDLYHVSIFLYNEASQVIRLQQGVGTVGEQMIAAGKQFRLSDAGLVPQAAQTLQAMLSNDVLQNANHRVNPLLPETRAELAIPMLYQGRLLGVLDLQSQKPSRFRDEDIRILKTLADQIAVAVRNSQLFEEVSVALGQAERAISVKSAFLASMSHELRTPLNAIINFTKFVAKGSMGPINAEQQETLNEVIDSAKHLLNLINDVLDMSKIEAGSLTLFVESNVDLAPTIKTVTSTGRSLIAGKPVSLEAEIAPDLPLILGDRQRILQILLNIMSNACKFTEQGTITLRAAPAGDEIVFSVSDTGPGIAPEDQPAVFEAFKQTTTGLRQGGGTGLGMPISKRLAEAHGGRLWLTSEPGKGSTFFVALPIKSDRLEESLVV